MSDGQFQGLVFILVLINAGVWAIFWKIKWPGGPEK